jgi:SAM-dependent methyltransferase
MNSDTEINRAQLEVLSVAEGFFQSSVLFTLLKLKIFEHIGEDGKTVNDLASVLNARPETLSRLLNAGVVLKLLESTDGLHYSVSSACRSVLLPTAGENYLGNWIRNLDYFRLALSTLDEAVIKAEPTVDPEIYVGEDKNLTREYILAMHNYASHRGKELARFLNTQNCSTLLDLGCGAGTYAFQLALQNPNLHLFLLDHPGVLEIAREVKERYQIDNEVQYLPFDALKDEIPGAYDVILISNMLHMLSEQESSDLVKRLYKSTNPGGSLVVQAQYLQDDRMGGRWPVLLDLIQLCITARGRNHSVGETKRWMSNAGFTDIEYCSMTLLNTNSFLRGYRRQEGPAV